MCLRKAFKLLGGGANRKTMLKRRKGLFYFQILGSGKSNQTSAQNKCSNSKFFAGNRLLNNFFERAKNVIRLTKRGRSSFFVKNPMIPTSTYFQLSTLYLLFFYGTGTTVPGALSDTTHVIQYLVDSYNYTILLATIQIL